MKEGINFASRSGRGNRLAVTIGWLALLAALAGTAIHLLILLPARSRLEAIRVEISQNEDRLASLRQQMEVVRRSLAEPDPSSTLRQLIALEQSGASRAASPPAVLSLLAEALPREAKIVSVRLKASPPHPELRFEARADSPAAASQLLGELAASPLVARAEILEERHLDDGEIYLRIGARLSSSEDNR